jgi:exodeoxyribonuclease VII large subunit
MTNRTPSSDRQILSVSQLNRLARSTLEDCFANIWVDAELCSFSQPSSGHWYFTLKDAGAQIRCAMFRNRNMRAAIKPQDGIQVLVRGKISLYEPRGDYQLIVDEMEPAGHGKLAIEFEKLKARLQAEGLFDSENKKTLPEHIHHVAVITSSTGAAIHDILSVLERRAPYIRVTLLPVTVQGKTAAPEIVKALQLANQLVKDGQYDFDVILAGRGGGSLEDLWSFNEETVARAIAASELPVISAVGHEVDFTIADFVADVRAPTPSAAAELISPDIDEQLEVLAGYEVLLEEAIFRRLRYLKEKLRHLHNRLRHPHSRVQDAAQRLDELEFRLKQQLNQRILDKKHALKLAEQRLMSQHPRQILSAIHRETDNLSQRLNTAIKRLLEKRHLQLGSTITLLNAVSPLATLERGYSITLKNNGPDNGKVVRYQKDVKEGDVIRTRVTDGDILSTVITK